MCFGTFMAAFGSVQQGRSSVAMARREYDVNLIQAKGAEQAGGYKAGQVGKTFQALRGTQEASAAASGFETYAGDPLAIMLNTAVVGTNEQWAAQRGGQMAGWAYRTSADTARARGSAAWRASQIQTASFSLSAGMQLASSGVQASSVFGG